MPIRYTVVQGDSVVRLAARHGLAPATIWNDPANEQLRAARGDMNILLPGDVVVIPDKRIEPVARATGKKHVFRRVGVPMPFRVRVLTPSGPMKGQPYVLEVGGVEYHGDTDDEGWVEHYITTEAATGTLTVGAGMALQFALRFGHMDPIATMTGIQKRLNNLAYACGPADGTLNARTADAIRRFQRAHGLEVTGEADDATRAKLAEQHDALAAGAGA